MQIPLESLIKLDRQLEVLKCKVLGTPNVWATERIYISKDIDKNQQKPKDFDDDNAVSHHS